MSPPASVSEETKNEPSLPGNSEEIGRCPEDMEQHASIESSSPEQEIVKSAEKARESETAEVPEDIAKQVMSLGFSNNNGSNPRKKRTFLLFKVGM